MAPELDFSLPARVRPTEARWRSDEWHAEVLRWVRRALADAGVAVLGPLVPHKIRPWASVHTVATDRGTYFVKQNAPGQLFEASLMVVLAEIAPDHVIAPVAVDPVEGIFVSPVGGPILGSLDGHDIELWCRVVAEWAQVQRRLAPYVARLADAGVTVMRTEDMPRLVRSRTDALHGLPPTDPRRMGDETFARVASTFEDVERWSEEVASVGLPSTLNHNDLHQNNVFVPTPGQPLRFFDFADSVVSEPLAALLIPMNVLSECLGADSDDARLRRVADAYLEVWSDVVPLAELRAVLPAGLMLARLHRVESWVRVQTPMTSAELGELGQHPALWLGTLAGSAPVRFD